MFEGKVKIERNEIIQSFPEFSYRIIRARGHFIADWEIFQEKCKP